MTTDEQKMKNNDRQRKHYDKHRVIINEKRRQRYSLGKTAINNLNNPPLVGDDVLADEPQPLDLSQAKSLSYDEIRTFLSGLNYESPKTKKKYLEDIQRIQKIIKCDNYITCLKNPKKVLEQLRNGRMANGNIYALNTIKGMEQLLLFMIDQFKLTINKSVFTKSFEINKMKSDTISKEKQNTEVVLPFHEYLEKVKSRFGEKSQMFVLSSLYDFISLRDDFQLIITDKASTNNKKDSYITLGRSKNSKARMIINQYKTVNKYGIIDVSLPIPLTTMIKEYIATNKLKEGDYLFGTGTKLSAYVSANNKKIGIKGAITYYRKMSVADLLNKQGVTEEEKYDKAQEMKHSPFVQGAVYYRKQTQ